MVFWLGFGFLILALWCLNVDSKVTWALLDKNT